MLSRYVSSPAAHDGSSCPYVIPQSCSLRCDILLVLVMWQLLNPCLHCGHGSAEVLSPVLWTEHLSQEQLQGDGNLFVEKLESLSGVQCCVPVQTCMHTETQDQPFARQIHAGWAYRSFLLRNMCICKIFPYKIASLVIATFVFNPF